MSAKDDDKQLPLFRYDKEVVKQLKGTEGLFINRRSSPLLLNGFTRQ